MYSKNELLPVPSLLEAVNTKTIPLLATNVKTHKLSAVNRDCREEALKILNIGAKVLARRSNAMWDILFATEDSAKALAGNILTTKSVRLQTECLGTRKTRVTLHRVPVFIMEDHLGFFFSKFGQVNDVSAVKSKARIVTGDFEVWVTIKTKISWTSQMF